MSNVKGHFYVPASRNFNVSVKVISQVWVSAWLWCLCHCRLELEPITTCDSCSVIWLGNESWLYLFPFKTSASSSVFLVWKGSKHGGKWWNFFFCFRFWKYIQYFYRVPLPMQKTDLSFLCASAQTDRDAPLMTLSWKVCPNFTTVDVNFTQGRILHVWSDTSECAQTGRAVHQPLNF